MSTETKTTDLDLDAIAARANAATPGPWGVGNGRDIVRDLEVTGIGSYTCVSPVAQVNDEMDRESWRQDHADGIDPRADAEFIAAARTDVPALVAELRRLRAELGQVRDQRDAYRAMADELRDDLRDADESNGFLQQHIAEIRAGAF